MTTSTKEILATSQVLSTGTYQPNTFLNLVFAPNPNDNSVSLNDVTNRLQLNPSISPVSISTYAYYATLQINEKIIAQTLVLPQSSSEIPYSNEYRDASSQYTAPLLKIIINQPTPDSPVYEVTIFTASTITGEMPSNVRVHIFRADISTFSSISDTPATYQDISGIPGLSLAMVKKLSLIHI